MDEEAKLQQPELQLETPAPRTADEVLNAMLLDLAGDPDIAPYLGYVAVPIQLVPADKTLAIIERVIVAFARAKGATV